MNNNNDLYFTKDLPTAAYLIVRNIVLQRVERKEGICWFVFCSKETCEKLADEFWFGNSQVQAKAFYEAMQSLKVRIFA